MNILYLVRHGENQANLTLEFSHRHVDYSLTPKGIMQARQTGDYLRDKGIQAVYSSPLKRAVETAEYIAAPNGLTVTLIEQFREVNVGDLEGQPPTPALWAQHNAILDAWLSGQPEVRFPGGEDYHMLQARAKAGFEQILSGKEGQRIVVVGHGGIFSTALRGLFAGVNPQMLQGPIPNCSITTLETGWTGSGLAARLLSYASTAHLTGEAANLVRGFLTEEDLRDAE